MERQATHHQRMPPGCGSILRLQRTPNHRLARCPHRQRNCMEETSYGRRSAPTDSKHAIHHIYRNANHERVDLPETWHVRAFLVNMIRNRDPRLCNSHYLANNCTRVSYPYDHESWLSHEEFAALLHVARSQVCPYGSACGLASCNKGHMCPNGKYCKHSNDCWFAPFHGMDTEAAFRDDDELGSVES